MDREIVLEKEGIVIGNCVFRKGDKVKLDRGNRLGHESRKWWKIDDLELRKIYTVDKVYIYSNYYMTMKVKEGLHEHCCRHFSKVKNESI